MSMWTDVVIGIAIPLLLQTSLYSSASSIQPQNLLCPFLYDDEDDDDNVDDDDV